MIVAATSKSDRHIPCAQHGEQQGDVTAMAVGQEEAQKINIKMPPGVRLTTERVMLRYLPELSIAGGKAVAVK